MTEDQAFLALRSLIAAYQFGGLEHAMWEKAEKALNKLEAELRATKAERQRAQEACEQISKRLTTP